MTPDSVPPPASICSLMLDCCRCFLHVGGADDHIGEQQDAAEAQQHGGGLDPRSFVKATLRSDNFSVFSMTSPLLFQLPGEYPYSIIGCCDPGGNCSAVSVDRMSYVATG